MHSSAPFTAAPKSPSGHTSHTVFSSFAALPSLHSAHVSTPYPATHPDGQLRQAAPRVPPGEWKNPLVRDLLGDLVEEHLDVDALLALAARP